MKHSTSPLPSSKSRVAGAALIVLLLLLLLPAVWRGDQSSDPAGQPGEPLQLSDDQQEYSLGPQMQFIEDPGGSLTIEQVASPEYAARFSPSHEQAPNFGFTNSIHWVRFSLENLTAQNDEWLLEQRFANLHYVDLYTPLPDGQGFAVRQSGALRPAALRDVLHPKIVFALQLPPGARQTYYMRFQSAGSMTVAATLWSEAAFSQAVHRQLIGDWLFFGAVLALLLYHCFLLLMLRERSYLTFVLFLASVLFQELSYSGYLETYLLPGLYAYKQYYLPAGFILLVASLLLFSDAFLDLQTRYPRLHRLNLIIIGLGAALLLTSAFSYHATAILGLPWALLSIGLAGAGGIITCRQGFQTAGLFMVAWLGMLLSLGLVMLVRLGLIPSTFVTENAYHLGALWMAVCWSIALAERINVLKAQTERANLELKRSEGRLAQILDGLPLGVVLYGSDQKPRYANPRTIDLVSNRKSGILANPAVGRTLAQAIQVLSLKPAGSRQNYPLESFPVFSALQGQPAAADDIEMEREGQRIPLEMWASPIRDESGQVEAAVAVFQEISQRKAAEAELAEHRKHLEQEVEKRTAELNTANEQLSMRLEWLSALNQVNQTMARSADFGQIYHKTLESINRLFGIQNSFIAELAQEGQQVRLLAFCCQKAHPEWNQEFSRLPEALRAGLDFQGEHPLVVSKERFPSSGGALEAYIHASGIDSLTLLPLRLREQLLGFLGLGMDDDSPALSSEESALLGLFSSDVAQLIENNRLFEQARALIAGEERNRLARELHDSVTQTLFTASLLAESAPRLWQRDRAIASQNMEKLSVLIRGALAEMRAMLIELRTGELHDQTLDQLLQTLVEGARARTRAALHASLEPVDLPPEISLGLYRMAREALNNALVHSGAAQIELSLQAQAGGVRLRIQDDGCGFDPQRVPAGHLGLHILGERAAETGAGLQIDSSAESGTTILITWPQPDLANKPAIGAESDAER